jgi:hypothetical protein
MRSDISCYSSTLGYAFLLLLPTIFTPIFTPKFFGWQTPDVAHRKSQSYVHYDGVKWVGL